MTEIDIVKVCLNVGSTLRRCKNCGCITELYRNKDREIQYRKIGEYDSLTSPNKFTIYQEVLDEYICLLKNGRLPCQIVESGVTR